jgi:uncharacterized phosphosugar-binding protein
VTMDLSPARQYLDAAQGIVQKIHETQLEAIGRAALICADSIANGGLVHLFGTGHSRIPVEHLIHCVATGSALHGPLQPAICRIGQQIVDSAVLSAREKRTVMLVQ